MADGLGSHRLWVRPSTGNTEKQLEGVKAQGPVTEAGGCLQATPAGGVRYETGSETPRPLRGHHLVAPCLFSIRFPFSLTFLLYFIVTFSLHFPPSAAKIFPASHPLSSLHFHPSSTPREG